MNNIEKEVRELVARVLKQPVEKVTMDANLFTDLNVDSLLGIEIFAALDKKYKIDVPESKLHEVKTLKDIVKIVEDLTA